mmetsp:Transcript_101210/g.292671  ORF Transcript_101210/g.292671 Transcript_101210/m.292671 type:complete len:205 (-) Transcript_101210:2-616(-)
MPRSCTAPSSARTTILARISSRPRRRRCRASRTCAPKCAGTAGRTRWMAGRATPLTMPSPRVGTSETTTPTPTAPSTPNSRTGASRSASLATPSPGPRRRRRRPSAGPTRRRARTGSPARPTRASPMSGTSIGCAWAPQLTARRHCRPATNAEQRARRPQHDGPTAPRGRRGARARSTVGRASYSALLAVRGAWQRATNPMSTT